MRWVGLACASLAVLALAACGTPAGPKQGAPAGARKHSGRLPSQAPARAAAPNAVHIVAKGENLYRISKRYGTSVDAIVSVNGIKDVHGIPIGTRLLVPTGSSVPASRRPVDAGTYAARDPRGRSAGPARFTWPVHGIVTSEFGLRHGAHHDGLDIKAPLGTIVRAAESGRVIHADASLSGYGNMVILKHADRFSTVYAHNRKLLVRVGQFVEKGDAIAEIGKTGNATVPHLHFEIRSDGSPRDPLAYLR